MSKQAIGWGCALVALVGLWTINQLTAQEAAPVIASARYSADAAVERINAVLDGRLKTPLRYEGEQLNILLEAIADEYNISIIFDHAALDEVAISPESEIQRISLFNISLRSALNLMLKEPGLEDLCYVIEEEVLLITTEEKANETLSTQVYRVDDLLDGTVAFNNGSQSAAAERLIHILISCVEHDSWQEHGTGEGEIHFMSPGMIVVSQTRRVHDQVEELFHKLRSTKADIADDSKTTASIAKPVTKGYAIDVELGENSESAGKRLAKAITQSVDWASAEHTLAENETWIEVLPERVLVHHLPTVLSQVEIVLADMEVLDAAYYPDQNSAENARGGGGFFSMPVPKLAE